MNTIYYISLLINPENKIYKNFKKRGFFERDRYISFSLFNCPKFGEKIHLIECANLNQDLKKFLSKRNIPLVFEVEDVIYSTYSITHKIEDKKEYTNKCFVYLKVKEVEKYDPYNY
jgi:hypothetical protein